MAALPPFAAVVVAAGKGLRAGQGVPKQFAPWRGKPLVRHSVESFVRLGANPVVVAVPAEYADHATDILGGLENVVLVPGGETRQESVANTLEALVSFPAAYVLIHDAARPDLPEAVVGRLLAALEHRAGAIPVLPVVDSLAIDQDGLMAGTAPREDLRRVQTPQAFRFDEILSAHRDWQGAPDAGDDAQVARSAGISVGLVDGDERLNKLTYAADFRTGAAMMRTGTGFDVHRLAQGEQLWLCGVQIDHDRGLAGHSDADVGLHAVVDAILGACALGDIGEHFPPSDPRWRGAPSAQFITRAVELAEEAGYAVGNVDLTLICEAPKIGPHREAMRTKLAGLLGVDRSQVSVKATTTERLGFTGRGEGIAAQAVATLVSRENQDR